MKNAFERSHWFAGMAAALFCFFNSNSIFAATQTLAPAGTVLNIPHNYTWNRMTVMNQSSGEVVPFAMYQLNNLGKPRVTNVFTLDAAGFVGAINLYSSSFDPSDPLALMYADGVVGNGTGVVSKSFVLPAGQIFEVVFSAAYATNASGTFSATISGPNFPEITTVTNISIRTNPKSPTVPSGNATVLDVYALGPLPHTWQWFSGVKGDASKPIFGATNSTLPTPALYQNTSYWVRVTGPGNSGVVTSQTAVITIANNPNAYFSGSLSANGCRLPNGELYGVQRFQIQQSGNYAFTLSNGYSAATYTGIFDAQHPANNLWGVLNGFYTVGSYDLVIRAPNAGTFGGTISGGPAVVVLLTSLPPQFVSGPQDVTITNGQSATFGVSTTCGTLFSLQWYRGFMGDTSNPIPGATGFTYTTPPLTNTTRYWVRMLYIGGTNDTDYATAILEIQPAYQTGVLSDCDRRFNRPADRDHLSGLYCPYKVFVYRVSESGGYTFSINATGFVPRAYIYGTFFNTNDPSFSLYALSANSTFISTQLSGAGFKYLVVSGSNPTDTGTFSVTVSNGPSSVTLTRAPVITNQPPLVNLIRGQSTSCTVVGTTESTTYQWWGGTDCGMKAMLSGSNTPSFTTPPLTVYTNYWAELENQGGYVFSTPFTIRIQPVAAKDTFELWEDETLIVTNSILLNDTKADNRSLVALLDTAPAHGTVTLSNNGTFVYRPATNYNGPDSFAYRAYDGTLTSAVAQVEFKVKIVNDAPERTSLNLRDVVVAEDTASISMGLTNVNYSPGGGADESSQQLSFRVTTLPAPRLGRVVLANQSAVVTNLDYNLTQLRGMNFAPSNDAFGSALFAFTVTDNGETDGSPDPRSIAQSLNIGVSEVNDPPVLTNGVLNNFVVLQDSAPTSLGFGALGYSPGLNEHSQALTYRVLTVPTNTVGRIIKGSGTAVPQQLLTLTELKSLSFQPETNVFGGPYTFAFTVTDDGTTAGVANALSITQSISITVSQINYPPMLINGAVNGLTVLEDSATTSLGLESVSYSPGRSTNEAAQVLTYRVLDIPPVSLGRVRVSAGPATVTSNQSLTLAGLRNLTFTPAADTHGSAVLTFSVTDNGNPAPMSITQAMAIAVSPVADTPSITSAITLEGIQTTSGLVISRHSADGAEVGFFKISAITNGTLFQTDGTTIVADGSFVTFTEGNAGLKFTPKPGRFSPTNTFGFKVQASLTNSNAGLGGAMITATIVVEPGLDFGDAPDATQSGFVTNYPTTFEQNGARHVVSSSGVTLFLGAVAPDLETNGVPDANASGDNSSGENDEDGIALPHHFVDNHFTTIVVIASGEGKLDAWLDWNRDGDWLDAKEQIATNFAVVPGENLLQVRVPAITNNGVSYARFRLSSAGNLSFTGVAADGEVEDYAVNLVVGVPPQISCPSNIVVMTPAGELSVSVPFSIAATGAPVVTVTCFIGDDVITSPHLFSSGTMRVDCIAENGAFEPVSCSFTVTVNAAPSAQDDFVATDADMPLTFSLVRLTDNDADADGQFLRVTNIGPNSARGGSISVSSTHVTYTPPLSFVGDDTFRYSVVDEGGATASAVVRIAVTPQDGARVALEKSPNGFRVRISGTPGRSYFVEASPTPAGPWSNLVQVVTDGTGAALFDDTNSALSAMRLYRTRAASSTPKGLLNWYRAESNFLDSVGPKPGLPSEGFEFVSGPSSNAFHFDGSNSVIMFNAAPVPPPWTAGFWVNRQNSQVSAAALLVDGYSALKLEQWPDTRQVGITSRAMGDVYFNYIAPENTWVHLAFVTTPTQTQLFVDGILQGTVEASVDLPRDGTGTHGDQLHGLIDEVQLFDRALTSAEVQELFLNLSRVP